jgi:hypothetical protein
MLLSVTSKFSSENNLDKPKKKKPRKKEREKN